MYNNALNGLFSLFARWERSNAICTANKYLSPQGVQRNLKERLKHNEMFRHQIFKGRFREEITNDKLEAAKERIEANYRAGLIDSGKYQTQLYKINTLRNMRFAESYQKWSSDTEGMKYYKLKYAAQLGEDIERIAFGYHEKEQIRKQGVLYGVYHTRGKRHLPDKPMI